MNAYAHTAMRTHTRTHQLSKTHQLSDATALPCPARLTWSHPEPPHTHNPPFRSRDPAPKSPTLPVPTAGYIMHLFILPFTYTSVYLFACLFKLSSHAPFTALLSNVSSYIHDLVRNQPFFRVGGWGKFSSHQQNKLLHANLNLGLI